jgi:hypothetical protein
MGLDGARSISAGSPHYLYNLVEPMLTVEMISSADLGREITIPGQALVVMPFINATQARRASQQLAERAGCSGILLAVHDDHREGFVKLINRAFAASRSETFAYAAEDAFAGRDWLAIASKALERENGGLAAFNDGKWAGQMASFGLAERAWANSVYGGPFFFPDYHSHYADTELSVIARAQNKYTYDANAVLIELDYNKDKKNINKFDKKIFLERKNKNFEKNIKDSYIFKLFS